MAETCDVTLAPLRLARPARVLQGADALIFADPVLPANHSRVGQPWGDGSGGGYPRLLGGSSLTRGVPSEGLAAQLEPTNLARMIPLQDAGIAAAACSAPAAQMTIRGASAVALVAVSMNHENVVVVTSVFH